MLGKVSISQHCWHSVLQDFLRSHWLIWIIKSGHRASTKIQGSESNLEENMSNLVVSTVSVDGLTQLGARTSADTVMKNKFALCH